MWNSIILLELLCYPGMLRGIGGFRHFFGLADTLVQESCLGVTENTLDIGHIILSIGD